MRNPHALQAWLTIALVTPVALSAAGTADPAPGHPTEGTVAMEETGRTRVWADADTGGIECAGAERLRWRMPRLADAAPERVEISDPDAGGWRRVSMRWRIDDEIAQDDLSVEFEWDGTPDFHWLPHLTPEDGYVVGQHVFRSPAMIVGDEGRFFAVVPDLELVGARPDNPWYLDLDAPARRGRVGMTLTEIPVHVGFTRRPGMRFAPGEVELAFYTLAWDDDDDPPNPWGPVRRLLWRRWGHPLFAGGEPGRVPMDVYVRRTYEWAFDTWEDSVWQEFELDGHTVGAPQFIVNVTQSPNYSLPWKQREFLSIWNQAWFSSLRSASGLARWARRTGDKDLARRADLTRELALAAPMRDGIFPSVIRTDNVKVEIDGKEYPRPKPWTEAYWTNSNRRPWTHEIGSDWYHVLDAAWTTLLMVRWHCDIEPDPRLLEYASTFADRLVLLQDDAGFFPGWLHPQTHEPGPVMNQTPETSLCATFLFELADAVEKSETAAADRGAGSPRSTAEWRRAAGRAVDAVVRDVVPVGRWEDFETYWSCCSFGNRDHLGIPYERNGMYKQNTLSMFWTAEALLAAARATGDDSYLRWGRRTLDELSMAQQVWQPPFIYVPALGGFGVMNFDGEWNDARQSLFAELFLEYGRLDGDPELLERGTAALRASFVMMYCPENPEQKVQWEKARPFFGVEDYGFMMENYGHGGTTSPDGGGIGTFTIYDWGNGAAAEARNRIRDHFGDVYLDSGRGVGVGIDSVSVDRRDGAFVLRDISNTPETTDGKDSPRTVRVVFADGSTRDVVLDGDTAIPAAP